MVQILNASRKTFLSCGLALIASLASVPAAGFAVIHGFQGTKGNDGAYPVSNLIRDNLGNLYGTTAGGGEPGCRYENLHGCGAVFRLSPPALQGGAWTETLLHVFEGYKKVNADGAFPLSGLLADHGGNLYGTTWMGGTHGGGIVFKLGSDGTETLLYSFCGKTNCTDGTNPEASLIADKAGDLYGTTRGGGTGCFQTQGCGTVFKLAPDGSETVLYSFCSQNNCTDGAYPYSSLIADSAGNLYGTTENGGINCSADPGCGIVFRVAPNGAETVLYTFCSQNNCSDGALPSSGLVADSANNLYGTTRLGGVYGFGTVFKLAPDGTETVLYGFGAKSLDGSYPNGVVIDKGGNFYGTTQMGGNYSAKVCGFSSCGTVFRLANDGTETILHSFRPGADGVTPVAGVLIRDGHLFGTVLRSGANRQGTVFELDK
jgi:uncharacterized repeat protein (TIGR03803 family)